MARAKTTTGQSKDDGFHVALLRGVNVGGRNKLPMADLAAVFVEAGCADVRTYIQSGNVVFSASPKRIESVPDFVANRILERFGFRAPVVLRSADEFRKIVDANPFLKSGANAELFYVAFLADRPAAKLVAKLDPNRSPGDFYKVMGGEVYLHLPNGVARSKLTNAYFDSKLATISTARNWRTVLKLLDMTQQTV